VDSRLHGISAETGLRGSGRTLTGDSANSPRLLSRPGADGCADPDRSPADRWRSLGELAWPLGRASTGERRLAGSRQELEHNLTAPTVEQSILFCYDGTEEFVPNL